MSAGHFPFGIPAVKSRSARLPEAGSVFPPVRQAPQVGARVFFCEPPPPPASPRSPVPAPRPCGATPPRHRLFVFTWMWTVSSLFLNSRGVHFGRCGRLRDKASMPSGFPVDSRVPVTVFEVPGRKGIGDIDACATAYQAVGGTGHGLTRGSRAGCMCPGRRWRRYASREDFSPRPAGRAGRTPVDSGYAEIVEGWSAADPGLPRKQRHTAMRVWQRLREPRVRGLVSVGAASGQAVAGAASREVGGGTRGSRGHAGPRRLVSGQARASIAGVERVARFPVVSYPYPDMRYVAALPGGTSGCVCHGLGEVFACVGMAPRVVVSGQRHGRGASQLGWHGHADRDVPAVLRAVRVRGEVPRPVLGQREGRRGERGRVRAPQLDGAGPVGGGLPGVGDARGPTRANGSRRPTITGSACPSPACSNRRRSICSRRRPPRSTRSSGVR